MNQERKNQKESQQEQTLLESQQEQTLDATEGELSLEDLESVNGASDFRLGVVDLVSIRIGG